MTTNNHGQPLPVHAAYAAFAPQPTEHTAHLGAAAVAYTPADIAGPYILDDKGPERTDIVPALDTSPRITITGVVRGGKGQPIAGAVIDFWQADGTGHYSGGFPDQAAYSGPPMGYRGRQTTDAEGRYTLTTIMPGHYKISDTEVRTAHIHYRIKPPGGPVHIGQLYFPEDEQNQNDKWERANDPKLLMTPGESEGSFTFDFTIRLFH